MYANKDSIKNYDPNFGKIKVGVKTLEDAILSPLSANERKRYCHGMGHYYDKHRIFKAIATRNYSEMRAISDFFYRTNGIYKELVDTYSTCYRWDWYISGSVYNDKYFEDDKKIEEIKKKFNSNLNYLDDTHIKKICGDISHKVVKYGVSYQYISEGDTGVLFQELPTDYCRSRMKVNNMPAVELNMRYFDVEFPDPIYRQRVLKMFPKDIQRGYVLFKSGKLKQDFRGDMNGWYMLDPGYAVEFSLISADKMPMFINVIPKLMDLDDAQELDKRKQLQELAKVIVQELPLTSKGDLIFDMDEAVDIHNNTVSMLQGGSVNTDVITTFAKVSSIDLSQSSSEDKDGLERVERSVFNAAGVPSVLFNSDGNLTLSSALLRIEGVMRDLKLQFEIMFDTILKNRDNRNKKNYAFSFFMLDTTQYNYKEMSKMYKEQMTIGYSKVLAEVALGHSQKSVLSMAYFENDVLDLVEVFIPPLTSNTLSSADISTIGGDKKLGSGKSVGRPKSDPVTLSDKTLQNQRSM